MSAALTISVILFVVSGQITAVDRARASGGKTSNTVFLTIPVRSADEMSSTADLVVHARVTSQRTVLSEDRSDVMTEYTLAPLQIVAARTTVATKPSAPRDMRVRRLGGKLVIDGLEVETVVDAYPAETAVATGSEAVFFLLRSPTRADHYNLAGGPYSIFRVKQGQVWSLTPEVAADRGGDQPTTLADFLTSLKRTPR